MEKTTIQVVEDDDFLAASLKEILEGFGYVVPKPVATGENAILAVKDTQPDLVIMDIELAGDTNGIEAAEVIKTFSDVPIIFITAHSTDYFLEKAKGIAPYGYLTKPFKESDLSATIEMSLYRGALDRKLRESERKYRFLIETLQEGIWMIDEFAHITFVNPIMAEMIGYKAKELIGKDILSFMDEESRKIVSNLFTQCFDGIKEHHDLKFIKKDGSNVYISHEIAPITDEKGICMGFIAGAQDITWRKEADEILRKKEEKFRDLADSLPQTVFETDIKGNLIYVNSAAYEMFGYSKEDYENGINVINTLADSEKEKALSNLKMLLSGHKFVPNEYLAVKKDGTSFPVIINSNRIVRNGETIGLRGVIVDITERKDIERQIIQIRDLALTLGGSHDLSVGLKHCLKTALDITGLELGGVYLLNEETESLELVEYIGISDDFIKIASDYPKDTPNTKFVMAGMTFYGKPSEVGELSKPLEDEGFIFVALIPFSSNKKIIGCLNLGSRILDSISDVAKGMLETMIAQIGNSIARLKTEDALSKSEERYRTIIETTKDGILLMGYDGGFREMNNSFCEITGYSHDELKKMSIWDIEELEDKESFDKHKEKIKINGSERFETRIRTKENVVIDVEVTSNYMEKENILVAFFHDITERKRLEQKLLHSQKMETVGRLAGGVAHDFNNILTVINANAELSLMFMDPHDPSYESFLEIKRAGERAADLTRQLLAFSRKQIIEPKNIDINNSLNYMDKMLRRLIGENIEFEMILDKTILPVRIDPGQFEQVITNFVVNARDAMPNGGKITIKTGDFIVDESFIWNHPDITPGKYTRFSVTDTGIGIDKETLCHIFEPFFTTKSFGSGTGLGLSTCYGIISQNNGAIWMESVVGQGSTIYACLPSLDDVPVSLEQKPVTKEFPKGSENIILVEDDTGIRNMVARALEGSGYKVFSMENGKDALAKTGEIIPPIQLLVTDVIMPGMGGKELADQIKKIYPDIKVLFMSGYTEKNIAHHGVLDPGIMFIQKPFSMLEFTKKIRNILDSV